MHPDVLGRVSSLCVFQFAPNILSIVSDEMGGGMFPLMTFLLIIFSSLFPTSIDRLISPPMSRRVDRLVLVGQATLQLNE